MSDSQSTAPQGDSESREKTVLVVFRPELGLPPESYTTRESAGYKIMSEGEAATYRVWAGRKTLLYPVSRIHRIELEL